MGCVAIELLMVGSAYMTQIHIITLSWTANKKFHGHKTILGEVRDLSGGVNGFVGEFCSVEGKI